MMVACQWNISSPTGPAEQLAGGSLPRSTSSVRGVGGRGVQEVVVSGGERAFMHGDNTSQRKDNAALTLIDSLKRHDVILLEMVMSKWINRRN
jgi:hypothetical protein